MLDYAKENSLQSLVITFDNGPERKVKQLIFTLEKRVKIIKSLGTCKVEVLSFNRIKNLRSKEFFEKFLLVYDPVAIFVGEDFRFGYKREGDIHLLKKLCIRSSIALFVMEDINFNVDGRMVRVSSSLIRKLISKGDVKVVEKLLGREYFIEGKVVKGIGLGKKIGFPTINLLPSKELVLPRGIFVGECFINSEKFYGVADIGTIPTVKKLDRFLCEIHLLSTNFSTDIKDVLFRPLVKVRDEKKFNDINILKKQILQDVKIAAKIIKNFGGKYAS